MLTKKDKMFLAGFLAFVLTMLVGYALFSQQIEINGTAKAEARFEITPTCEKGIKSTLGTAEDIVGIPEGGFKNDSCTVDGNIVTYHADLDYPGALRFFTVKLTNTGTIDAAYDSETDVSVLEDKMCEDGSDGSTKNGTIEESECIEQKDEKNFYLRAANHLAHTGIYDDDLVIMGAEKADGTLLALIDGADLEEEGFITDGKLVLKPGESIYAVTYAGLSEGYNNSDGSFLITHSIKHAFNFKQAN